MSLAGYPTRRQYQQQNVRAIRKVRAQLMLIRVPRNPQIPTGEQRPLTDKEILFLQIKRTSNQYSILEHTAATEQLYQTASPAQALRVFRENLRKDINLEQEFWPDAEAIDTPILLQDLRGRRYYVFRLCFAYGNIAAGAAVRSEASRDGWTEKIKRLQDLAQSGRRVVRSIQRYEREIIAGWGPRRRRGRR